MSTTVRVAHSTRPLREGLTYLRVRYTVHS